jgi:hypothetical protein
MYKLSHFDGDQWKEHSHPPLYEIEPCGDAERIRAGVPSGESEPFERLVRAMEPPYLLLYVLHTPRGEAEPGRYQSGAITSEEFRSFMARFASYLSGDARFDIWAYSPEDAATVVWDRHNQLFAYGPLDRFTGELQSLGFSRGVSTVPDPHQHHYRPELDLQAAELLASLEWRCSPLREEDEQ